MLKQLIILTLLGLVPTSSAIAARVIDGLVVGYDFREGGGDVVFDHSLVGDPLNLTVHDPSAVTWNPEGSITITAATIISTASDLNVAPESSALKLFDALTETAEITIEAWVEPASLIDNTGAARIISMSVNPSNRNFTLGQEGDFYEARWRTEFDNNGFRPRRQTDFDTVTTALQHVVYTRSTDAEAFVYIDGEEAPLDLGDPFSTDPIEGDASNWDDTYDFGIGNELTWGDIEQRDWQGTIYLAAVYNRALSADEVKANFQAGQFATVDGGVGTALLQAGDADQDLDFDQLDLVKVQISAKYLSGQAATWGDGDWDGAPGGEPGSPPAGNGFFDQLDIISALAAGKYLTGPYAALAHSNGVLGDEQTTLVYDPSTGELSVDSPANKDLTSINITSTGGKFIGDKPAVLDGAFDNFATDNIFKATFGGSFGDISFGDVLSAGLSKADVVADLTVVGSLAGGGDLGNVDLFVVPEPSALLLLLFGILGLGTGQRLTHRKTFWR